MHAEFVKGNYDVMDYTPTADVATGAVVVIGDTPCVCNLPGGFTYDSTRPTRMMALAIRGGFYRGVADGAIAARKRVYWDATNSKFTLSAVGNKVFGVSRNTSAADGDYIEVEHDPEPLNNAFGTQGASTAAAGSTTADAGVLPAATGNVYPTTAADDTKGVRVHADDKVKGRTLLIGNGVSNKILKVYPPSGGTINGAAADAAFSSASGKGVMIHCLSSTGNTWLAW
jgi:hypothetical protein